MLKSKVAIVALLALATPVIALQSASTYPERPIRLVIGSAPGSGPDIVARVLSERLYKSWQQRIVVDARPGLAGAISAELGSIDTQSSSVNEIWGAGRRRGTLPVSL